MADRAFRAKRSVVRVVLGVTRGAVLRRALEDSVDVALLAVNGCMFPVKMEGEFRVIHGCRLPAARRMTGRAVGPELSLVLIIIEMAGNTILGRAFEYSIDMALLTGDG